MSTNSSFTLPLTDLYGNTVGELTIDRDGNLTGTMDSDSFWVSISRVGNIGVVRSLSIMPNPMAQYGR